MFVTKLKEEQTSIKQSFLGYKYYINNTFYFFK
jgi:hypothetical protein